MHRFVCLLRGVNVGGNNMVKMADLKAICEGLGLTGVRTHLQSGNVVFDSRSGAPEAVARRVETGIRAAAGIDVKVVLRTPAELRRTLEKNPYPEAAGSDPSHLLVVFLAGVPPAGAMDALRAAYAGPEPMHLEGRELYVLYGDGMARSKLTNALIEKKLGVSGTARNWNTVTRLVEMAES